MACSIAFCKLIENCGYHPARILPFHSEASQVNPVIFICNSIELRCLSISFKRVLVATTAFRWSHVTQLNSFSAIHQVPNAAYFKRYEGQIEVRQLVMRAATHIDRGLFLHGSLKANERVDKTTGRLELSTSSGRACQQTLISQKKPIVLE